MRDLPPTPDLLALASRTAVQDLPPAERERHAHLAATARAIAAHEADSGDRWQEAVARELADFYAENCRPGESQDGGPGEQGLLARLAADLRNGAFETTPSREPA